MCSKKIKIPKGFRISYTKYKAGFYSAKLWKNGSFYESSIAYSENKEEVRARTLEYFAPIFGDRI